MPLPVTFANLTTPSLAQLDQNFAALGNLVIIPCGVVGTNALVLSPSATSPNLAAYANYMAFSGIIAANNTGAVTVQIGALAALSAYLDSSSGPVALASGNLVAGTCALFIYDSALNAGAGGFHTMALSAYISAAGGTFTGTLHGTAAVFSGDVTIGDGTAITRLLSTTASITFPALAPAATETETITITGAQVGDSVSLGTPAAPTAGIILQGYVSAANTVTLAATNVTAGTLTPAGGDYRATVIGFT